ncbi:hypothetical protein NQZ68_014129 [Dissostichus eleginoides]|nr:hypothetical protein NQZ68_014129 [Dissostichus eleginoides]
MWGLHKLTDGEGENKNGYEKTSATESEGKTLSHSEETVDNSRPSLSNKGDAAGRSLPECIPGDLNTWTAVLREKHDADKDDCVPPRCAPPPHPEDYNTASDATSIGTQYNVWYATRHIVPLKNES